MMKKLFCLCFAMIFALCGCTAAQTGQSESTVYLPSQSVTEPKETTTAAKKAAQTMLENMTLREKIGQLFIIRPEALGGNMTAFDENTALMLKDYPVGGVALFGKNISDEAQLTELAKYSMLIGIDEEGGKVARIAQNESFDVERFDSMGNVKTADEAENIGKVIGKYLKKYGINLNFAPVADVDSNPDNPVIGVRAFSCDPDTVSEMVSRQIDGYHQSGIITSIKHFPGHGDTDSDTHMGYVSLDKPWNEPKKVELVPFKNNLDKTDTVMV